MRTKKCKVMGKDQPFKKWYQDNVLATKDGVLPDFSFCVPTHPNLPHSVK
jgi:hypothetical protein